MEFSEPTIFISYSRGDGRTFAEAFEKRLEDDAGIRSWRDLKSVEGGEDIRPQVLRAIEQVKHLVLILTRRALASDWVRREWTHARTVGRKVSPVLADPGIKRSDLPAWIRRADVYDIADPERWTMLVQVLRGSGETRRVPYMTLGPLPDGFVPRPAEYKAVKKAVLPAKDNTESNRAVALRTALQGAGGYGKTTLANALCHDVDVRFEFSDGIVCVEVGKERSDVTSLIVDLIEKLDPQAKRPGFQDVRTAAEHLGELIGEARLLLVIDDVWREAQLKPFLTGGPNCVRLVTTRLPQVLLGVAHEGIDIDKMQAEEATSLISTTLPVGGSLIVRVRLAALAKRLGYWAQMLSIANRWIKNRIYRTNEPLATAIDRFEQRLKKRGLVAFDPRNETDRNRAIRACIEASLEDLDGDEVIRFGELAILPEDEDVSLAVIEALWHESGSLDDDDTDDLLNRLHGLSLLQKLDLDARTLRLHDNMIWYLCDRIGPDGCRAAHETMISTIQNLCDGDWATLSADHTYGWRFLVQHLRGAERDAEANRLLTDYAWIKAKLAASGALNVLADYLPEPSDQGARLVGQAIALSAPTLTANPRELSFQLVGRLGSIKHPTVAALVVAAHEDASCYLKPRWPGMTPPIAERLRFVGHRGAVVNAAFSFEGGHIVTSSDDGTARLWDIASGTEIAVLCTHQGVVFNAAFSSDGTRVVTSSNDRTARLCNIASGTEIAVLCTHQGMVFNAAFSPDGARVVTASADGTARLWDAASGAKIVVLYGHSDWVTSAMFSPDGKRVVTASEDSTVRLWDAFTGTEIGSLCGHQGTVFNAAFSPDGTRVVTASADGTAQLWDAASGAKIVVLYGHSDWVTSAVFSPDGKRVVTASDDNTARLWDAFTGTEIGALCGHQGTVFNAAFSPDGTRVVTSSNDNTARLWDAFTGIEMGALCGHHGAVFNAAFSPDGTRVVTASDDNTARLWDVASSIKLAQPHRHRGEINSVALSPNGTRVVTQSDHSTSRLWDASTGAEITVLCRNRSWMTRTPFSPDGSRIVISSGDGIARLWDAATGAEITPPRKHLGQITCVAFSSDSTRIVTATSEGAGWLWDDVTGVKIAELRGHRGQITCAAFSPSGTRIVTSSYDRTARLWDATSGAEMFVLRGHEGVVDSTAFSVDGIRVVTIARDHTARLWDVNSGVEIALLCNKNDKVNKAWFSEDGTYVVTVSYDYTVRLWNSESGKEIAVLHKQQGAMNIAFSANGHRVVTSSDDGTIQVWDVTRGVELAALRGHEDTVNCAAFSFDDSRVITVSRDTTARVWDVITATEIERITFDAAVTALAVYSGLIAVGDALGQVHVLTADKLLLDKES